MRLFIDTWAWVVLSDRSDPQHGAVDRCYKDRSSSPGRIVTSDYVLDELITLLFLRKPFQPAWRFLEGIFAASHKSQLLIEPVRPNRFRQALELRRRYRDKPRISFTDLTSMVIMQELRVRSVLTADTHFHQVGLGFEILPG